MIKFSVREDDEDRENINYFLMKPIVYTKNVCSRTAWNRWLSNMKLTLAFLYKV